MRRTLYFCSLITFAILCSSPQAISQQHKIFKTHHTNIYYTEINELSDFLWKIGRLRISADINTSLLKSRVDRIVEQVEAVLDMYPENFHIDIFLRSGYKKGNIAFYSDRAKSITIFVDRVTDGVLAHEVAHAVVNAYFKMSPPSKIQEILGQYADASLWQEYH